VRHETLIETALALADVHGEGTLDALLQVAVSAAGRIAGTGAVLVLADSGRLERVVAHAVDEFTRDTVAHPDVVRTVTERLSALRQPLGPRDLDPATARVLGTVAPRGFVLVPVDTAAFLALIGSLDRDAVADVTVLARLTAPALAHARAVTALRESCEELRRLSTQVLVRQDEDLARMAHELHEGTCQRLAAANADLEAATVMLDGQRAPLAALRDARSLVNQTLGELRELAQRMRPSVLVNLGYVEALRWYAKRLRDRSGVTLSLEVEGAETRLPLAVETALYRATEEALGPAAGAREPRRLRIRYRRERETVRLELAGAAPGTVDLVAIRERLRPFGGAVHVSPSAGDHAVIRFEVPAPTN